MFVSIFFCNTTCLPIKPKSQKSKRLSEVLRVKTSINSCDQKMIFLWPENFLTWNNNDGEGVDMMYVTLRYQVLK